jgi:hypothetical protein
VRRLRFGKTKYAIVLDAPLSISSHAVYRGRLTIRDRRLILGLLLSVSIGNGSESNLYSFGFRVRYDTTTGYIRFGDSMGLSR